MAGLADDAPTRALRQTCIDVLCAYLRLPYTAESDLPADDAEAWHAYRALREVRHTVIRLIRDHLRLAPEDPHSWQGHDFDLTEVTFDGGDFAGAQFRGGTVTFTNARFSGGTVTFARAQFFDGRVDLTRAQFCGSRVTFTDAELSGARISFRDAGFSEGRVSFQRTRFAGGTIMFTGAEFLGSTVSFSHTTFSGGTVDFTRADGVAPTGLVPPSASPFKVPRPSAGRALRAAPTSRISRKR
ncbi:pentapeptide repeat-containing protein [Streptomyces humi]